MAEQALTPIEAAKKFLGRKEGNPKDAAVLSSFFSKSGGQTLSPADTAWCAAFANAVLGSTGRTTTKSLAARSFLGYGTMSDSPKEGDVVVFSSPSRGPSAGHVGFFAGYDAAGNIQVIGGNQSNGVTLATYPANRVLGFRSPPVPTSSDIANISSGVLSAGGQTVVSDVGSQRQIGNQIASFSDRRPAAAYQVPKGATAAAPTKTIASSANVPKGPFKGAAQRLVQAAIDGRVGSFSRAATVYMPQSNQDGFPYQALSLDKNKEALGEWFNNEVPPAEQAAFKAAMEKPEFRNAIPEAIGDHLVREPFLEIVGEIKTPSAEAPTATVASKPAYIPGKPVKGSDAIYNQRIAAATPTIDVAKKKYTPQRVAVGGTSGHRFSDDGTLITTSPTSTSPWQSRVGTKTIMNRATDMTAIDRADRLNETPTADAIRKLREGVMDEVGVYGSPRTGIRWAVRDEPATKGGKALEWGLPYDTYMDREARGYGPEYSSVTGRNFNPSAYGTPATTSSFMTDAYKQASREVLGSEALVEEIGGPIGRGSSQYNATLASQSYPSGVNPQGQWSPGSIFAQAARPTMARQGSTTTVARPTIATQNFTKQRDALTKAGYGNNIRTVSATPRGTLSGGSRYNYSTGGDGRGNKVTSYTAGGKTHTFRQTKVGDGKSIRRRSVGL